MKSKELTVANRYLVIFTDTYGNDVREVRVVERAKDHVKLAIKNSDDNDYFEWRLYEDIKIIENLGIATHPTEKPF